MTENAEIVVFGTGSFAARILMDIAATATTPVRVAIAGRNAERREWLRTAGAARAAVFGTPARFVDMDADLNEPDAATRVIDVCRPVVVVQAASAQASAVIAGRADSWAALVREGGLSASAVFQALLSARVARAVPTGVQFVNCCFPDVVNGIIAALGLPIACGVGNVGILSNAFAGTLVDAKPSRLHVLAHYQCLAPFRVPPAQRGATPPPRVWIDDAEVSDVYDRFARVRLTVEPVIEISGAAGVPLLLAMAAGRTWRGHVPGPHGLPGGYPVAWDGRALSLDLPPGLDCTAAVAWNGKFEEASGLVVGDDGFARYTGALREKLHALSPALASGFAVGDLEAVHAEMAVLRARLQAG